MPILCIMGDYFWRRAEQKETTTTKSPSITAEDLWENSFCRCVTPSEKWGTSGAGDGLLDRKVWTYCDKTLYAMKTKTTRTAAL